MSISFILLDCVLPLVNLKNNYSALSYMDCTLFAVQLLIIFSLQVTQLLSTVSEAVSGKVDPLHAVLQTKFNLYGTPFERELFDIEPPLLAKQTVRLFIVLKKIYVV